MGLTEGTIPATSTTPPGALGRLMSSGERQSSRLLSAALRLVDPSSLAVFRILLGLILAAGTVRFIALGWVDVLFGTPTVFLHHWATPFIAPFSAPAMLAIEVGLVAIALCIAAGAFTRVAFALFTLGFGWAQLADVTNYLNHYYLVLWLCVLGVILPTERVWSVDAWRRRGAKRQLAASVPAVVIWLFRFQVALVYGFAAVAKAQSDWLFYGQPLGIWLGARTHIPVLGALFEHGETALVMSWAGFFYDATIVAFLLGNRTRPFAYAGVVVFHVMTAVLFDIGLFPPLMIAATLLFFSPSWPRDLANRVRSRFSCPPLNQGAEHLEATAASWTPGRKLAAGLIVAFVLFHLVMPLRFLAYDTGVLWGEEGMRWSWRVMVREKNAAVTYRVVSPTGRQWRVSPTDLLTWRQANEIVTQPDLILQLAHVIESDMQRRGHPGVAVFVDAKASLNGRRSARLIDPNVDLTKVADGILPARYILAAPSTPPLSAVR